VTLLLADYPRLVLSVGCSLVATQGKTVLQVKWARIRAELAGW
jgi:hypothetical protein